MADFIDILTDRIVERVSLEFRGFWDAQDLAQELPGLVREEFHAAQNDMLKRERSNA